MGAGGFAALQQRGDQGELFLRDRHGVRRVPLAVPLGLLDFLPTEVGHKAPLLEVLDQRPVFLGPFAFLPAQGEVFPVGFVVDALKLPVNPSEAEGLLQRLRRRYGLGPAGFAEEEPDAGAGSAVLG